MDQKQLQQLQAYVAQRDASDPKVSQWCVGQQIAHTCMVLDGICQSLQASEPPVPRAKITPVRLGVFLTGRIPQGRAKAPQRVHPEPGPTREELESRLQAAERHVQTIRDLPADAWFRHFIFDVLRRDQSLRFLRIHTDHHRRIIDQILRATS